MQLRTVLPHGIADTSDGGAVSGTVDVPSSFKAKVEVSPRAIRFDRAEPDFDKGVFGPRQPTVSCVNQLLLELPKGYTCSVVGNGMADPHGTQMLFQTDANGDGFMDYFRNALTSGTWSSSG
ncbi:unnamed protein product, partial [Prorocentrum cordatum]